MIVDREFVFTDAGRIDRVTTTDPDTGLVTVVENGKETTATLDADTLAQLRAEAREVGQLERLHANFTALRDGDRLTPATYRQNTGPADLRPIVQEINALRAIVLDLTRLVRGMAAEE